MATNKSRANTKEHVKRNQKYVEVLMCWVGPYGSDYVVCTTLVVAIRPICLKRRFLLFEANGLSTYAPSVVSSD